MKNLFILCCITIISITTTLAKDINGKVRDSKSMPLHNVSIHIKHSSHPRIFTDENGKFTIDIDGIKEGKEYILILSHIGYKTTEYVIKKLKNSVNYDITLLENSILLDRVVINKKLSRKREKARKISIVKQFKAQLERDFKLKDRTYKVASNIEVMQASEMIFSNKLTGEYIELIGGKKYKWKDSMVTTDSIAYNYIDIQNHLSSDIQSGIEKMSDRFIANNVVSKRRKENKRILDSTFYSGFLDDSIMRKSVLEMHEFLWKYNRNVAKKGPTMRFSDDPKAWEIIEGGEQTILRYRNRRGMLGIVKHEMTINYIVDPDNYSLERIYEESTVEVHIPFGYRLPPDVVMLLNVINSGKSEIEKYRARHFIVDASVNSIYKTLDGIKYADQKSYDLNVSLIDTKKRNIKIHLDASTQVLSVMDN